MKHILHTIILPFILHILIRIIYFTNKKVFHHPKELTNEAHLICFWHGELLMQAFNYRKLKPEGKASTISSEHRDSEAIVRTIGHFGIRSIRGSSTRGGTKALISAIAEIRSGGDIAITPDGPKGPRHSLANGIVAISQKTNAKILVFNCKPTKYWQFNSWDKFILPKPFGTLHFYVSEPFSVEGLEIEEAKNLIREKLLQNAMK